MAGAESLELICAFTVGGKPASRGSKQAFVTKSGKINLVDGKNGYRYMKDISACAKAAMAGRPPVSGPIVLYWVARFSRPKCHYHKKTGMLISGNNYHIQTPDISKLVRGIEDACSKIVYQDDKQIVRYASGSGKEWTCGESHTEIAVFAIR